MLRRVIKALLTASVLLAPGLSEAVSYKLTAASTTHYATLQEACLASTAALNTSGSYSDFKYLSATEKVAGYSYTCNLQGQNKFTSVWKDLSSTVFVDAKGCAPGQIVSAKSSIASVTDVDGKYFVATRTPDEGCLAGCNVEPASGSNKETCFFVTGSTTQGFCNYTMKNTGTSCSSNTLAPGATGDPMVKPEEPTDPGDDGTGTPTNPGCVFDCDDGGSNGGSSGGGTGGTGGTGSDGGTGDGGSGGSNGGDSGTGNGGDTGGNDSGGNSGNGSGGTGGTGGSSGSGTDSGTPCKGLNFGEAGCAEYVAAQGLNSTLATSSESVKTAQDAVWSAYDDVVGEGDKIQQSAEDGLLQRFGSMLPAPGACVNPVMDLKWTVITVDVCRYTFVKQILGWMFAVFTMIYVYRTMTSLGTNNSEA